MATIDKLLCVNTTDLSGWIQKGRVYTFAGVDSHKCMDCYYLEEVTQPITYPSVCRRCNAELPYPRRAAFGAYRFIPLNDKDADTDQTFDEITGPAADLYTKELVTCDLKSVKSLQTFRLLTDEELASLTYTAMRTAGNMRSNSESLIQAYQRLLSATSSKSL